MKSPIPSDLINQITRREWLLRLGETAVLAGVSGLLPEAPLQVFGSEQQYAALPPGLYEPSLDDLVHALGTHQLSMPPKGSETDYVQPGLPYQLQFFSPEDFRTVTALISVILGDVQASASSETANWVDLWFHSAEGVREAARSLDPLHRTLAVAYFGEAAVLEIETSDPATVAREGITELNKLCVQEQGKTFTELSAAEQQTVVRAIGVKTPDSTPQKFYELLRNQLIRGYYTSAQGLKELDYKGNAYYPYCPGCESEKAQ